MDKDQLKGDTLKFEETLLPSFNSIDLKRTIETDYNYRFGSKEANIAELYHENSKLVRGSTVKIPDDLHQRREQARTWYFDTSYDFQEKDLNPKQLSTAIVRHRDHSDAMQRLFAQFSDTDQDGSLLYGLDIFLYSDDKITRLLPGRDFLWIERFVDDDLKQLFAKAIIDPDQAQNIDKGTWFFVVGAFWRHMMLVGPRGYRNTLYDVGAFVERFSRAAVREDIQCQVETHFYEHHMDDFLLLDGTERSTLALIRLEE